MVDKVCPLNLRMVCDARCPFRGFWIDKETGEKYLSCYRLHVRIADENTDAPSIGNASGSQLTKGA